MRLPVCMGFVTILSRGVNELEQDFTIVREFREGWHATKKTKRNRLAAEMATEEKMKGIHVSSFGKPATRHW